MKQINKDDFLDTYYLKVELQSYCREHGLQSNGSKKELEIIIMHYLQTEEKLCIKKIVKKKTENVSLDTKIEEHMVYSESNRIFFKQYLGDRFRFSVPFQKWLKANVGKTYREAIEVYPSLRATSIDQQFKYNTYIRDFFKDNEAYTLKDAISCCRYKKGKKGNHKYEKSDLEILK